MQIFVVQLTGKIISIDIEPTQTVEQLKEIIATREGIPVDQQTIIFAGRQREDGGTLSRYYVRNEFTPHFDELRRVGASSMFLLNVITASNELIRVTANGSMAIAAVKKVLEAEGHSPHTSNQRLFVGDLEMENHKMLRDYNITGEAVIRMETQSESTCCIL